MIAPGPAHLSDLVVGLVSDNNKGHFNYAVQVTQKEETVDITITNEQKVKITCTPVTAGGAPATLDGPIVFSIQAGDCTLQTVDASSVFIVSGTVPGDSVVLISADADLGSGVQTIADTVNVTVAGAQAASLGLVVGTPELK